MRTKTSEHYQNGISGGAVPYTPVCRCSGINVTVLAYVCDKVAQGYYEVEEAVIAAPMMGCPQLVAPRPDCDTVRLDE